MILTNGTCTRREPIVPAKYSWPIPLKLDGYELEVHDRHALQCRLLVRREQIGQHTQMQDLGCCSVLLSNSLCLPSPCAAP
jgi:hypothetical protein